MPCRDDELRNAREKKSELGDGPFQARSSCFAVRVDLCASSPQQLKMDAMRVNELKIYATTLEDLEQTVDVPVSLETAQERISGCIVKQFIDVPQFWDETTAVVKLAPHEVDVPVSLGRLAPHERVQQRTVDVPVV